MSSDTKAELQAIGVAFHPLRNIDDVADLLEAAARVPAATPRRYERIAGWLSMMHRGCIATAFQIGRLLSRLALDSAGPDAGVVRPFEALVARIPPSDGQVVVTARTKCVVCCGDLLEAMNDHDKLLCSHPQLFTRDGAMADCTLLWKRCGKCKAHHYYSYAVGGEALPDGKVQVYPGWDGLFYTHVTEHAVFETQLLKQYRQQCLHSHSSCEAFAKEYFALAKYKHGLTTAEVWAKSLAKAWRGFELVTWLQEMDSEGEGASPAPLLVPISDTEAMDAFLLASTPRLLGCLVARWGKNHHTVCRQSGSCDCYVIDGHMKCLRSVCANKLARVVNMGTLGTAVLGCTHMPVRGSIYCRHCRESCAVKGAGGEADMGAMALPQTPPEGAADERNETAAQEAARHRDVYMVADVLDAEPQTVVRGGEAHRACTRQKKLRLLVSWVGYPESDNSWVCECNAGKAVVEEWKEKQQAAKAAKAVERKEAAAAAKAAREEAANRAVFEGHRAAANLHAATGDFNMSAAERQEILDATDCKCLKDVHSNHRAATAGIVACVSSCGLILAAMEMTGSESLTQVHLFLYTLFFIHQLQPPAVLAYDDGCHLSMFLLNRLGRFGTSILSVFLLQLHKVKIKVDKFHWKNHTGTFCKRNNNPYECKELAGRCTEYASHYPTR
jgi:hypothetical protein